DGTELLEVRREQRDVMGLYLRAFLELLGIVLMVRQLMMRIRDAELRVGPRALLASVHERDYARQVALIREHLQVVEQLHVLVERVRNAYGTIDVGQLAGALLACLLDAPFDIPQRLEVVADLRVVRRAQLLLELPHPVGGGVENASLLAQ